MLCLFTHPWYFKILNSVMAFLHVIIKKTVIKQTQENRLSSPQFSLRMTEVKENTTKTMTLPRRSSGK